MVSVYFSPSLPDFGADVCGLAAASQSTSVNSISKSRGSSACRITIDLLMPLPLISMALGSSFFGAAAAPGATPNVNTTAITIAPAADTSLVIVPRTIRPPPPVDAHGPLTHCSWPTHP